MKANNNSQSRALRIMLVEDNEHDRAAFRRTFKKLSKPSVITDFLHAEDALEQLTFDASRFDILVSDYMLPGMNGLELCKALIEKRVPIPMVILTGSGSEQIAVDAIKAGVDDYIVKDPNRGYLKLIGVVIPEVVKRFNAVMKGKRADEHLKKELQLRATLIDNIPGCIALIIQKNSYKIVASNRFAGEIGAVPGLTCYRAWALRDDPCPFCLKPRFLETDEIQRLELEFTGACYETIWAPLSEDLCVHYIFDITQKKRIEAQLNASLKTQAIAVLAGGVAHEFNNALTPIVNNIELLRMDLPQNEKYGNYLREMELSTERMSSLAEQLLAYAQGGKYKARVLQLNELVKRSLSIVQHCIKPSTRIATQFEENGAFVEADETLIQTALSAMISNSDEAMENGGIILIGVQNQNIEDAFSETQAEILPGQYVCLSVEDNGKGMNKEEKSKIFDPFFSTKFQGRGMGMAAAYGIVKNHGGFISVDSTLGKGTVVRIYLPAVKVETKGEEKVPIQPMKALGRILVIESESNVLRTTRSLVEHLGYQVLTAKNGKSAVRLAETFEGEIDLALLCIRPADMKAGTLYQLLMNARPKLKVILFSPHGMDESVQAILDAGAQGFVQRPLSINSFSQKIKTVLVG